MKIQISANEWPHTFQNQGWHVEICVQSPFGVFLGLENKESLIVKLVAIKTGCKFSKTYDILEKKINALLKINITDIPFFIVLAVTLYIMYNCGYK